jgi:hemolysin activation/secretion protein
VRVVTARLPAGGVRRLALSGTVRRGPGIALGAFLLCAAAASASDFDRIAPRQPTARTPSSLAAAPAISAAPGIPASATLIDSLRAIRFVSSASDVVTSGSTGRGILIQDLPFLDTPEIRIQLRPFLGQPLTGAQLSQISAIVVGWYRRHNHPLVDVAFPEQDLSTGVLQAVVTEFRVGRVRVAGNRWFNAGLVIQELGLGGGDTVDFNRLNNGLNTINRNPFRSVGITLQKSAEPGATDIALNVQDRFPLRLYTTTDNTGVPVTGRDRYAIGLNWGNVFGWDHQLSYQFITSPDLWRTRDRGPGLSNAPRFTGHSFTYRAPLPWGDVIDVFGAYVAQVPDLGPDFGQVGHSLQFGGRYTMPLWSKGAFTQQLQLGFDYKRADSNLAFGGASVFSSATNVEQFLAVYDGTLTDRYGQTALENTLTYSPGGFSQGNSTAVFQASGVTGARANYVYDNVQLTRVTALPWKASAVLRLTGQFASTELLPSEQLGAGGLDSVRGYDERAASGSDGYLASFELRSPPLSPLRHLIGVEDQGQLLAFFDYGNVSYKNVQSASAPRTTELQSTGVGLRYGIGRYLDVRFDYGWQLKRLPAAGTHLGNLATVSVTLGY